MVRNKNPEKSQQEARRGKMSFFAYFKEEFQVIQERDPAIHSPMEVLLYPSFRVMLKYRRAHKLYLKGHYFLARWISQRAARKTGIEIHPGATIGKGLFIDHGSGVIIGETAIIGDNVTLYQGVTLGGNGKETGKRHPTLKDNVMVSAGAKIIGSFTIGENSKIGAGSVVIEEVPPNCTVVGVPGHIVKQNDVRIPRKSMDHIHLPDPIFEDIKVLQQENTELTNRVLELEGELRQMRKKERTEQKRFSGRRIIFRRYSDWNSMTSACIRRLRWPTSGMLRMRSSSARFWCGKQICRSTSCTAMRQGL